MSAMEILLFVWGAFTLVLIGLLIYKSTLEMHEDDQLFLTDAEAHLQNEQIELQQRMNKLTPFVRVFGAASGMLVLVIAGMLVIDAIHRF
jgi:hypothetical protein